MRRWTSRHGDRWVRLGGRRLRMFVMAVAVLGFGWSMAHALAGSTDGGAANDSIKNNRPFRNPGGFGATFSTQGAVDLTSEYFQAQGTNRRSCATCHLPQEAWSISPDTLQRRFADTGGTDPVFNVLDANNPNMDVATEEARLEAYSMLLSRGVFRRGGVPMANAEWELVAADDPHGYASATRLVHWRRAMPTINFPLGSAIVNWDGGNSIGTDQHAGLVNQATRNVTGGQQGPPAAPEVIANIVEFETLGRRTSGRRGCAWRS